MAVTPEDLDLLRNPERIFRALLDFPTVPEERKAFLRRAKQRFEAKEMTPALFSRVLEIAYEYGLFEQDMRSFIPEVTPLDRRSSA